MAIVVVTYADAVVRLSLSTVQRLHPNLRDSSSYWLSSTSLVRNEKQELRGRNKKRCVIGWDFLVYGASRYARLVASRIEVPPLKPPPPFH